MVPVRLKFHALKYFNAFKLPTLEGSDPDILFIEKLAHSRLFMSPIESGKVPEMLLGISKLLPPSNSRPPKRLIILRLFKYPIVWGNVPVRKLEFKLRVTMHNEQKHQRW